MRQSEDEKERCDKKEDGTFAQTVWIIRTNDRNFVKLSVDEIPICTIIDLCKLSSMFHIELITSTGIYFSLRKHQFENVANIFRLYIGKSIWRYEVDNRIIQSVWSDRKLRITLLLLNRASYSFGRYSNKDIYLRPSVINQYNYTHRVIFMDAARCNDPLSNIHPIFQEEKKNILFT